MSKIKIVVAGVLTVALITGAVAGAAIYFRNSRQETVPVVSVDSIAADYYTDDTMLEGNIVTNVTQNVNVDQDMIIKEVYVTEGDSVAKGDPLISFDMTLVQMELNIARLKQQQQEQDLTKAENRLTSLRNGGPIEEETDDSLSGLSEDDMCRQMILTTNLRRRQETSTAVIWQRQQALCLRRPVSLTMEAVRLTKLPDRRLRQIFQISRKAVRRLRKQSLRRSPQIRRQIPRTHRQTRQVRRTILSLIRKETEIFPLISVREGQFPA